MQIRVSIASHPTLPLFHILYDGIGMFNHKDTLHSASWQAQLVGQKKWHICGPEEDQNMYVGSSFHISSEYLSVYTCSLISPTLSAQNYQV